ncbi:hypothetical protein SAMN04488543_3349 [Friedmanniella luteola]|uniref:Uncharacterized protein n=1 Tax=Friedmanniella luteola TaxID=546871 RepID=A0A1H1YM38_9ACTN|nr:hypothetical protein [Friedmanniella luteola]SDT22339.1 hypothetical protein SAMN04488543_3349 [Friedmanniella luteola]
MIPQDWTPVHRPDDDELVGYLVPGREGCTPVTLFGHPLSGPTDGDEAEALLLRRGLPVLADPWWLDGGEGGDGEGYRVQIMSADPGSVVVARADFGFVAPDSERHRLPVPTDRLRPHR